MEITETVYFSTREGWRKWLSDNHAIKNEIWLIGYLKQAGKPTIPYNDAVEEALCFGWIDSIRKKIDHESNAQRYSPRRPGSGYSQTNKERLARLIEAGKVIPSVLEVVQDIRPDAYVIPADILSALQSNPDAWQFFQDTSLPYQRIRAAYVDSARNRPEEFGRRLENLISKSASRKQFGYGIEDYY
jgi:uncharacterized protein YdeI (YjbR/CyaY-like superfamily)